VALIYTNHFSKGNQSTKETIDRISGTGVWGRDPDVIFTMSKHAERDAYSAEFTMRLNPPIEPFVIRWKYPLFVIEKDLDPSDLKKAGRPARFSDEEILKPLNVGNRAADRDGGLIQSEWFKRVQISIPRSTFHDRVEKLVRFTTLFGNGATTGCIAVCFTGDKIRFLDGRIGFWNTETDLYPQF
jgi:hypothetical protein